MGGESSNSSDVCVCVEKNVGRILLWIGHFAPTGI